MIGVDTNVLLRLVTVDDLSQNAKSTAFFAQRTSQDPAFVGAIVLAETVWLLRKRLGYPRNDVERLVRQLLDGADILVEDGDRLRETMDRSSPLPTDIADFLIGWAAERAGCAKTMTFDRKAARAIPSMELLA